MHTSRRFFLSNVAVLSAGMAIGRVKALALPAGAHSQPSMQQEWEQFRNNNGGQIVSESALPLKKRITPCKGHEHKTGESVYFPKAGIYAQPVWIYWLCDASRPSDMVIHFYKKDGTTICINRYELAALSGAGKDTEAHTPDPLDIVFMTDENRQRRLFARTIVGNKKIAVYAHGCNRLTATPKIIYNV